MKNRDFSDKAKDDIYKKFNKGRSVDFLARHYQTSPKVIMNAIREKAHLQIHGPQIKTH